jgi:hypothetical protein
LTKASNRGRRGIGKVAREFHYKIAVKNAGYAGKIPVNICALRKSREIAIKYWIAKTVINWF